MVKYWLNDAGKGRPTAISVTVYRRDLQGGGSYGDWEVAQTYTLSEDNHWSAAWSDRTDAEFQVAENGTAVNADGTSYQVSISTSHGTDGQGNPYRRIRQKAMETVEMCSDCGAAGTARSWAPGEDSIAFGRATTPI